MIEEFSSNSPFLFPRSYAHLFFIAFSYQFSEFSAKSLLSFPFVFSYYTQRQK